MHLVDLLLHIQQGLIVIDLTGDDVELTSRRFLLGIYIIPLAGGGQGSALVEILGIDELGRKGITHVAPAQCLSLGRVLTLRVSRLDHEVLDDPVEQRTIVWAFLGQLNEVVPMFRCLVVEFHHDVSRGGLDFQSCFHFSLVCSRLTGRQPADE